jgi:hypothetical protein
MHTSMDFQGRTSEGLQVDEGAQRSGLAHHAD